MVFIIILLVLFVVLYRKSHNIFIREKELMQVKYQQELLKSQLEIQEETLKHISEEIHDNIGQVLSLAKLHLNVLPAPPNKANEPTIEKIKQLVGKAIGDLRSLSRSLHPDRINEFSLDELIRQELDLLEKTGTYKTSIVLSGNIYKLPAEKQTILFRIVQEAISNIIKHAAATEVHAQLLYEPHQFTLQITDNGIGISTWPNTEINTGIGLKNMRNRSALIGAIFTLRENQPSGTSVEIVLNTGGEL